MSRIRKAPPFPFVLETLETELGSSRYLVRPMFGCSAVYLDEKIVLILREREDHPSDNGVWLATSTEHHASLRKIFPSLRSIQIFGPGETGWQNLPAEADDFEASVARVCQLVAQGDERIGKVPARKKKTAKSAKKTTRRKP